MTTTEPTAGVGALPPAATQRDVLLRELVRAAVSRLGCRRLVAGFADGEAPTVLVGHEDGTVAPGDALALPMQVVFARVRAAGVGGVVRDPDPSLVPPELAGPGSVMLAPMSQDGFRGVLLVEAETGGPAVADVSVAAAALAMGAAAAGAAVIGRPSDREALRAVTGMLASATRPASVVKEVAALIARTTSFDRCTVLLAAGGGELAAVASERADGPAPLAAWRSVLAVGPFPAATEALASRAPAAFPSPASAPELHPERWVSPDGVGQVLVVPMVAWDQAVGVLVCDAVEPGAPGEREMGLVATLAAQAALAVKISELVDALEQGRRHARLVLGAMAHASTQLSTDGVLSVIVDVIQEVLAAATVVAFSVDDGMPDVVLTAGDGTHAMEVAGHIAATVSPDQVAAEPRYGADVAALLPESVAARAGRALLVPLRRSGRHLAWVASFGPTTRRYRDADLRVVGALATQAALSLHTVRLLEAERESVARLEELSKLKTGFVATVSHELRTPLTAILGFSEILTEWIDDAEVLSFVDDVRREAVVLEGIIGNLLDTTRLEAGVLALDRAPIDVEMLVKEAVDVIAHSFPARRLEARVEPALPEVWGDPVRIRQVLVNLIENAAKYSPDEGVIEVVAAADADSVRFEVVDHGSGIPAESRDKVFERFFRLDGRHGKPGTGIGLYLVRELVDAHGGTVAIEDTPGGGCRVVVHLPAGRRR